MRNSMTRQRRFTKEFAEEAVHLVQTSGRTQREIAGDLGISLSTLVRWIGRSRDWQAVDPSATQSDVTTELKRLRRENEMLRQERDILKKATAFFAREGSR
jgi:transposase